MSEVDIKVEEWLNQGYKRYEVNNKSMNNYADFMLQKRFDDETGKRYFITVYCYDRKKYPQEHQLLLPEIGYMATSQFSLGDDSPFFNIEMNAVRTIGQVEHYFEGFWEFFNRPYYEKWDNE